MSNYRWNPCWTAGELGVRNFIKFVSIYLPFLRDISSIRDGRDGGWRWGFIECVSVWVCDCVKLLSFGLVRGQTGEAWEVNQFLAILKY